MGGTIASIWTCSTPFIAYFSLSVSVFAVVHIILRLSYHFSLFILFKDCLLDHERTFNPTRSANLSFLVFLKCSTKTTVILVKSGEIRHRRSIFGGCSDCPVFNKNCCKYLQLTEMYIVQCTTYVVHCKSSPRCTRHNWVPQQLTAVHSTMTAKQRETGDLHSRLKLSFGSTVRLRAATLHCKSPSVYPHCY